MLSNEISLPLLKKKTGNNQLGWLYLLQRMCDFPGTFISSRCFRCSMVEVRKTLGFFFRVRLELRSMELMLVHPGVLNVGLPKRKFYVLKPWIGYTKEA